MISFGGKTYSGKAEIAKELGDIAAATPNRLTRHVLTNIRVERTGPLAAAGTVYLTLYAGANGDTTPAPLEGPTTVGVYKVEFSLAGGTCRIAKSHLDVIFRRAPPAQR